jgi:hypothetical protein
VYSAGAAKDRGYGREIILSFEPDAQLNCGKIALIQVMISSIKNGKNYDAVNIDYVARHTRHLSGAKVKAMADRSTGVSRLAEPIGSWTRDHG